MVCAELGIRMDMSDHYDCRKSSKECLTVGWCALTEEQAADTFPPLLQERCLQSGEGWLFWPLGATFFLGWLVLTKLLQHLVNKEKLLMLEPFNLSYHGHILHGLALKNYNAVRGSFVFLIMSTFLRWLILFFIPSSPPP